MYAPSANRSSLCCCVNSLDGVVNFGDANKMKTTLDANNIRDGDTITFIDLKRCMEEAFSGFI